MNRLEVNLLRHLPRIRFLVLRVFPHPFLSNQFPLLPLLHLLHPSPMLQHRVLLQHLREVLPRLTSSPREPAIVERLELSEVGSDEAGHVRIGRDGREDGIERGREARCVRTEQGLDVADAGAVQLLLVGVEEAALVGWVQGRRVEARVGGKGRRDVVEAGLQEDR